MENLKILFLCPQPLWPVNTGARLRNFHLANSLGPNCQATVLQIIRPGEPAPRQEANSFQQVLSVARGKSYTPAKLLLGLTGPLPITVLNYTSENVSKVLSQTLEAVPYDAVQIESIHLFCYLETIQQAKNSPVALLDWHNIESELMQRYADASSNPARKLVASRTARLLRRLEDKALHSFAAHTVVSEREKEKLLARVPGVQIHVIPNGVDTSTIAGRSPAGTAASTRQTLLFVGSMDYHANSDAVIWFCREIWPRLAAEFPHLDFKIVGRNPPAAVQALASPRILITGTVEDVRPFYHHAFAVLVPLRVGGGTRLKILEAMAAGVPVISTRLGAEGLAVAHGRELLLADTADEMAASIRMLLSDGVLRAALCKAARALVETQYDWSVLGARLAAVYRSLRR